ncbi:hypothetical protein [Clostridium butyricum]|uniref:hypothetical protein n=1 Tax=Clostridium butyricum TaxID=1492 RepID=UPI002AB27A0A|nr:hypothetical protein [Clostridium butyricum]
MTKFEKIALQCAKQDFRNFKQLNINIKKLKRAYVVGWKNKKWNIDKIKDFREWNSKGEC